MEGLYKMIGHDFTGLSELLHCMNIKCVTVVL